MLDKKNVIVFSLATTIVSGFTVAVLKKQERLEARLSNMTITCDGSVIDKTVIDSTFYKETGLTKYETSDGSVYKCRSVKEEVKEK